MGWRGGIEKEKQIIQELLELFKRTGGIVYVSDNGGLDGGHSDMGKREG